MRYVALFLLLLSTPVWADEVVVDFSEQSVPVLNEELRSLDIDAQIQKDGKLDLHDKQINNLSDPTEDTDAATKSYVDAQISSSSVVKQIVETTYTTYSSTASNIAADNTIPQSTEGGEVMTLSITPTSATSTLVIDANVVFVGGTTAYGTIALFQDSGVDAIAAVSQFCPSADYVQTGRLLYTMTSGTTSATTFKIRAGTSAGTCYFNGTSVARLYGGVCVCTLTITEYEP